MKSIINSARRRTLATGTLVAACLLGFGNSAHALDHVTYPGTICKPTYAHQRAADALPDKLVYSLTSVYNLSKLGDPNYYGVRLVCPIARDDTTRPWRAIHVRATRNSLDRAIECSATSYDLYGNNARTVTRYSPGTVRGDVTIVLPSPSAANPRGAIEVVCGLPGNASGGASSAIHSIKLVENAS